MNKVLKLSVVTVFLSMVTFATNATTSQIISEEHNLTTDADKQAIHICGYILGNDGFCTHLDDAIKLLDDLKKEDIKFIDQFFDMKIADNYTPFLVACKRFNWDTTPLIKILEIADIHPELYLKFINQYKSYHEMPLPQNPENFIDKLQMPPILEIAKCFPSQEDQKKLFDLYYDKMDILHNNRKSFELLFNDCQKSAVNEPGYSLIAYLASTNQQFLIKNVIEFFSNSPKTILEILKSSGSNQLTPLEAARKHKHKGLARYLKKIQND